MSDLNLRAYVLARPVVRVADLQRKGLTYSQACAALEELEAERLVGHRLVHGVSEWSPAYQVDEQRVQELRRVYGMGLRLIGPQEGAQPQKRASGRLPRALVRRHVEEKHPGTLSRCRACRGKRAKGGGK